jgi:hypothetical protein
MRTGRNLILSVGAASVLAFASLWLATANPTIDAPGRPGHGTMEFTCIQAPWDVVLNHGEGQQTGGEWPTMDYLKTETACDVAGRRRFDWAIGVGIASVFAGAATGWLAVVALRRRRETTGQ